MRLGFSYFGFVYAIMLLVVYLRERRRLPEEDRRCARPEGGVLRVCQRIGAILTCAVALSFSDFNLREWMLWSLWLCASMLCMVCYVLYGLSRGRDRSGRHLVGAICPVLAFLFLGIYGVNVWLMLASALYGIGSIGLRLLAAREEAVYEKKRPVRRILRFTGVLLASLLLIALLLPIGARDIRFMKHWGNFAKGVDEQTYLSIGGQEQYVLMMGRDVTNPVIVYLHGGPAAPDTMVMYTFADRLMDSFTFVGWDQRGAGRTYYRNRASDPNNRTATFASALSDLDELVDYVRERFGKEKIILMGHSYGTILGSQYVLAHPEKVADYIAVGQVVSTPDGDLLSYQDALEKAKLAGDDTRDMEEACETFITDRTLRNMLQLRQYVSPYHRAAKEANTLWLGISSPYFGIDDFRWFLMQAFDVDAYLSLNQQLFDAIMTYRAMDKGLLYEVPVYFISGAEDWICPVELIETYMERISAPEKSLSLIPESGHAPQTDSPEDFVQVVREVLK